MLNHDELRSGYCSFCGQYTREKYVDIGIGYYEYWGAHGHDSRIAKASECCEAEVILGEDKIIDKRQHVARKDHADGMIKKGDRYRVQIHRCWIKNGPTWFYQDKKKVSMAKK